MSEAKASRHRNGPRAFLEEKGGSNNADTETNARLDDHVRDALVPLATEDLFAGDGSVLVVAGAG